MNDVSRLIRDIEAEARLTACWTGRNHFDPVIMAAMASVPREEFVPVEARAYAFDNGPLLIGHGQTISQPYIVALMTDLLHASDTGDRHRLRVPDGSAGYSDRTCLHLRDHSTTG
jgi:protein-L-isoaspartate(D-aspartate) O-methyltransferase